MKNTKNIYLKKGLSKKDLEIRKYRRRARGLVILLIIVGLVALTQIVQNMISSSKSNPNTAIVKQYINESLLNNSNLSGIVTCQEPSTSSSIVKGINGFMDHLFSYSGGFWVKFFIFLGIVYIIQIIFSLAFDVIELILLVFVAIKRLIIWIYRKITGRDKQDEKLKKIAEL